jgi:8-oxo-dGTP pyrophosphatase MutT (NUDIX family)
MPIDVSPWVINDTRTVYANPWITVTESDVTRPDGRPGIYGIVHAKLATGVVAVTGDERIVLVGQWRVPLDLWSWELPEGAADEQEDGLAAARRELREETGFTAGTWRPLGPTVHLSNSHSDERAELFVATDLTQVGAAPDGNEVLEVIEVSLVEALAMVDDGRITDALSVIGLLRYARSAPPST